METGIGTTTTMAPRQDAQRPAAAPREYDLCPVQESIKIVGRKWHLIILWELSKAPHGFNELKTVTRGISAKMLSQSLSELEQHDLVVRDIISERPLRVQYRLTDRAQGIAPMFDVLHEWGTEQGLCEPDRASTGDTF